MFVKVKGHSKTDTRIKYCQISIEIGSSLKVFYIYNKFIINSSALNGLSFYKEYNFPDIAHILILHTAFG